MMKYLGIDFGTKKVGIAVSDKDGKIAFPHSILPNNDKLLLKIEEITKEENIESLVIGESQDYRGNDNPIMDSVQDFLSQWSLAVGLPVHFEKEFLTTKQAKLHTSDKMADASAAALILQTFLDKQN